MGGKELVKMLVETGNGRNSRVIPWWKEYLEDEDQEDETRITIMISTTAMMMKMRTRGTAGKDTIQKKR